MTVDLFIYKFLAIIATFCGIYVGIYFIRLGRRLPQPPYFKWPFFTLGVINLCSALVYFLGLIEYDGFAVVSSTGRIIRVIIIGFQIMPYIMAKSMDRLYIGSSVGMK